MKTELTTPVQIVEVAAGQTEEERRAAALIGRFLRVSVVASAALVLLGLVLVALGSGDAGRPSLDAALGRSGDLPSVSPRSIADGIRNGDGQALILFGLLLLIISPSVRVAITVVVFLRERRQVLAVLAAIVLLILLLGLVGIGA